MRVPTITAAILSNNQVALSLASINDQDLTVRDLLKGR